MALLTTPIKTSPIKNNGLISPYYLWWGSDFSQQFPKPILGIRNCLFCLVLAEFDLDLLGAPSGVAMLKNRELHVKIKQINSKIITLHGTWPCLTWNKHIIFIRVVVKMLVPDLCLYHNSNGAPLHKKINFQLDQLHTTFETGNSEGLTLNHLFLWKNTLW